MKNEKVEYIVTFEASIGNKISLIKAFRSLTKSYLKPAKDAVTSAVSREKWEGVADGEIDSYSFNIIMDEESFKELSKNVMMREVNGGGTEISIKSVREVWLPENYGRLSR
jgi:hypothetical protein